MKIVIQGPVASGKTALAKSLSQELGISYYQMDEIVHDDEKKIKRDEKEQRKIINQIIRKEKEWIIEGMPRDHLEVLSSNATLIIYLYIPKKILKRRLWTRSLKIKLGLEHANYQLDKELYQRMIEYIENEQHESYQYISKKYPSKLVIMKNKKELEVFRKALREGEILKYQ